MRVSAPPFINPCYYGTDIDSRENLIACHHYRRRDSKAMIGVDSLGYLSVENVTSDSKWRSTAATATAPPALTEDIPTEIPSAPMKNRFETKISNRKQR